MYVVLNYHSLYALLCPIIAFYGDRPWAQLILHLQNSDMKYLGDLSLKEAYYDMSTRTDHLLQAFWRSNWHNLLL